MTSKIKEIEYLHFVHTREKSKAREREEEDDEYANVLSKLCTDEKERT